MVLDLILWEGDVQKGEYAKIGYYFMKDDKKVVNIVPAFPGNPYAIKKNEFQKLLESDPSYNECQNVDDEFQKLIINEYGPCHFQVTDEKADVLQQASQSLV